MSDNCHVEPVVKQVAPEAFENSQMVSLTVSGMGCPRCALRVQNSLVKLDGVLEANVYHNLGLAEVIFNPLNVGPADLLRAVADAGDGVRHIYRAQVIL